MRVLLADDHDLVRDALGALLMKDASELSVTAVSDLDAAFQAWEREGAFDVIVLDLKMPGMDGLSGAERMVAHVAPAPVVIMSGSARRSDVMAALRIGVRGFIPKTLAGRSLVNAVRLVAGGETYVPMDILSGSDDETGHGGSDGLTERERDVLFELRRGHSNKEIARALHIAETTVKLHLRAISDKLDARNRTEIVIRAIDRGLA